MDFDERINAMFLSKIVFDPFCKKLVVSLSSFYKTHQFVLNAFGNRIQAKAMFRVEKDHILVLSQEKPDWSFCARNAKVKEYNPSFKAGQILNFRLKANPVIEQNGKRKAICEENNLVQWMMSKGTKNGFEIQEMSVSEPIVEKAKKKGKDIICNSVKFDGMLKVIECEAFENAIKNGIGKAKSFGFGLLSVA